MNNIHYSISYKNHTPETSEGFYHADSPVLYAQHDIIGNLSDCPFPLKTESFEVLMFGSVIVQPDSKPEYGDSSKFAIIEYTKSCGHKVQERINFIENVQTFNHYGTIFTGESYSINDWKNRIEFFRNYPCEICGLVKHSNWVWKEGYSEYKSKNKHIESLRRLLDYNFNNWPEFFDIVKYENELKNSK